MITPVHVRGTFEVSLSPLPAEQGNGGEIIGRMMLSKVFHGELAGTSNGQMLGVRTATKGSAGYVAMELFSGTLAGRAGSFVLQHSSTMTRGQPDQSIRVVPDSGTDGLAGISGVMTIDIVDGKHFYNFEYGFVGGGTHGTVPV